MCVLVCVHWHVLFDLEKPESKSKRLNSLPFKGHATNCLPLRLCDMRPALAVCRMALPFA